MKDEIVIVTRTERDESNSYDFQVKAFHTFADAERWINRKISQLVKIYRLDSKVDVEDWFVKLNGWHHTVQFDTQEEIVC